MGGPKPKGSGNQGKKFTWSKNKFGNVRDARPGQRSKIQVKSNQPPPPFKRYGSLPPEIPWPDSVGGERRTLGENWREQLKSLNEFGKEQPGPEYRQTEREARRAAKRKTGPGKIAKALKTSVQLPGLPDGSPPKDSPIKPTKLRSGPPRAIGALGLFVEFAKDYKRIWAEASRGQAGRLFDKDVFNSWLYCQPVGTILPGDLPVSWATTFIPDVGSKERVEKGNSIPNDEFAWRKDTDGVWHLIPAPPSHPRSNLQFLPTKLRPRWQKDQSGTWRYVSGKQQQGKGSFGTPLPKVRKPQSITPPPTGFAGSKASGTTSFGFTYKPPGLQFQVPKPKFGAGGTGPAPGFTQPKPNFGSQSPSGGFGKFKSIFDRSENFGTGTPKPTSFGHRQTGYGGHQTGINDVIGDIRTRFRPRPTGGRLPTPGPVFGGSSFGTHSGSNFGTHAVQGGEVLSRIANRYGTTVNAFAQENLWLLNRQGRILKGVDYIRPGDRLKVPGFNR